MGGKIFYYIYKMKFPIDLVLITLLIVLMYCQPGALGGITTSVLGRIIAVCLIAHIALAYGRNAGLLAASIIGSFDEKFLIPIFPTSNTPLKISAIATIRPNVANIFTRLFFIFELL